MSTTRIGQEELAYPEPCAPSAWTKHGIALQPGETWEDGFIQNINSGAEPLDEGRWRLWYGVNQPEEAFKTVAVAEGHPGESMERHRAVLSSGEPADAPLAIGGLPDGWEPVQPVHIHLPDGRHRLYFWAHDIPNRVQRFLVAESTDGRRYRIVDPSRPCMYSFWDKEAATAPEAMVSNDGATVYQLPDGSFELYVQTLVPIEDREWPRYAAHDNLPGRVRVGLLGRYPVQSQYMDLEWCFSIDGRQWLRPSRKTCFPRGEPFEPDCYTVYPCNSIVHADGRWWLFYTGVNYAHNQLHSYGPFRSCLMWASTPSIWKDATA